MRTFQDRFWAKVRRGSATECWLWTASVDGGGYGQIASGGRGGKMLKAHRVAYELVVGPIPEGLHIDHLCRVRTCVNPAHLEPVTNQVNVLRGETVPARNASKTHCPEGHAYDESNTYISPDGARQCRNCNARREREYRRRASSR